MVTLTEPLNVAVIGATGYVGGLVARRLEEQGENVRALARSPEKAEDLTDEVDDLRTADVLEPSTLGNALEGIEVAYYFVHSMGGSGSDEFAEQDLEGARNFCAAAAEAGVKRIVYMGGLGDETASEHLRSRHETAKELMKGEVPVVYFRAAAVVGSGSDSFVMVRHLAQNLPVMITPRWVDTKTQPIGIDDVVAYMCAAARMGPEIEREIQIGGPDVVSYIDMMEIVRQILGKSGPRRVPVPFLTPRLSSYWVGLVTPIESGVARPLIQGLSTETIVEDPSGMELFDIVPASLEEALRESLGEKS